MDSGTKPMTPGQAVWLYKSILMHGEELWRKWIELGRWVHERRILAAAKARGTRGPIYAAQLKRLLGQFHSTFQKLSNNGTLSALSRCIDSLEMVEAFRNRLGEDNRPNHPQRVWRAYAASLRSSIDFAPAEAEVAAAADAEGDEERAGRMQR